MTHLEMLKGAFTAIGVEFEEHQLASEPGAIELETGGSGYPGFYHSFCFDAQGNLTEHGSYE